MNRQEDKLINKLSNAAPLLAAISEELSFTRAAEKLNVQQSAVSHRIRVLEQALGYTLFERTTRTLKLTVAGKIICGAASNSLDIWPQALQKLRNMHTEKELRLSTSSSLALKWLIPCLNNRNTSDFDITLHVSDTLNNFELGNIDVAIRFGTGPYPGLYAKRLSRCHVQPVISPRLLSKTNHVGCNEITAYTLLYDRTAEKETNGFSWSHYFGGHSKEQSNQSILKFDRSDLTLQAAINGLGIALGRTLLIEQDIKAGFLQPIGKPRPIDACYWLVCKPTFAETEQYSALVLWLKEQIKTVNLHIT
ncbi:LysR family transcriptional regulator [Vibrio mediterranei]